MTDQSQETFIFLTNAFEKIERSKTPELEKLRMLSKQANTLYADIKITVEDKIDGYVWIDGNVVLQTMTVKKCAQEAHNLFESYGRHSEAIQNAAAVTKYYKEQYERILSLYEPFYLSLQKLINRVLEKVELQEGLDDIKEESEAFKRELATSAKTIGAIEEQLKNQQAAYVKIEKHYFDLQNSTEHTKDWLEYLADRGVVTSDNKVRVVLALLANPEIDRERLIELTKVGGSSVSSLLLELDTAGVINQVTVARNKKLVSINPHFIKAKKAGKLQALEERPKNATIEGLKLLAKEGSKEAKKRIFLDAFKDADVKSVFASELQNNAELSQNVELLGFSELVPFAQKLEANFKAKLGKTTEEEKKEAPIGDRDLNKIKALVEAPAKQKKGVKKKPKPEELPATEPEPVEDDFVPWEGVKWT